jgi:hypothetical protein
VASNMNRQSRCKWITAGLVVLGTTFVSGTAARASSTTGIVITKGTTHEIGDPLYVYTFTVELTAGETLQTGGYFTVYDIPGVAASSLTQQPNDKWGDSLQLVGLTPSGTPPITDNPAIWNVTWVYNGSAFTGNSPNGTTIGQFQVDTTELPTQPTPTLLYVGTLNGTTYTDQGIVVVGALIPEPSSIVLLLVGAGAIPLVCLRLRRRQRRQRDQSA